MAKDCEVLWVMLKGRVCVRDRLGLCSFVHASVAYILVLDFVIERSMCMCLSSPGMEGQLSDVV